MQSRGLLMYKPAAHKSLCAGLALRVAPDILPDSGHLADSWRFIMSVKLRLKIMGRSNARFYRLNAIDSRSPRDGCVIEELGYYDPRNKDQAKQFVAKLDRCRHWLDVGAVPSETVSSLLKKNGLEHKSLRLPSPASPRRSPRPRVKRRPMAPPQRRRKPPPRKRSNTQTQAQPFRAGFLRRMTARGFGPSLEGL